MIFFNLLTGVTSGKLQLRKLHSSIKTKTIVIIFLKSFNSVGCLSVSFGTVCQCWLDDEMASSRTSRAHAIYTYLHLQPNYNFDYFCLLDLRLFACKIALFLFTCPNAISHTIQLSKTLHVRYLFVKSVSTFQHAEHTPVISSSLGLG